jgi:protein-disulfide isomerase
MHDTLFANQHALDDASLSKYAAELPHDSERVSRELANYEHARRVAEDRQSGLAGGVKGTPTFYIDGSRYDGRVALRNMLAARLKDCCVPRSAPCTLQ